MESNIEKLLEKCNGKIGWLCIIPSFTGDFEPIRRDIPFKDYDIDLKRFIEICDNRLDRAKTFLNEIALVLGFDFVALSIIANVAKEQTTWSLIRNPDDPILTFLVLFLFAVLIFLFVFMLHYRSQVHAWTAFKEKAILMKLPEK